MRGSENKKGENCTTPLFLCRKCLFNDAQFPANFSKCGQLPYRDAPDDGQLTTVP